MTLRVYTEHLNHIVADCIVLGYHTLLVPAKEADGINSTGLSITVVVLFAVNSQELLDVHA